MPYCPDCSAALEAEVVKCWNCDALFGPGSAWVPLDSPPGEFRERKRPAIPESSSDPLPKTSSVPSWFCFCGMLFSGALALLLWAFQFLTRRQSNEAVGLLLFSFLMGCVVVFLAFDKQAKESARVAGALSGLLLIFYIRILYGLIETWIRFP